MTFCVRQSSGDPGKDREQLMKKVAVIMGSDSDLPVVEKAINTLAEYGVPYEVHVFSAHRTPVQAKEFSSSGTYSPFCQR